MKKMCRSGTIVAKHQIQYEQILYSRFQLAHGKNPKPLTHQVYWLDTQSDPRV